MELAFWDTSSLVPLCVEQSTSPVVHGLSTQYGIVVWSLCSVEMSSAFARLARTGHLTSAGQVAAKAVLVALRSTWREIQPSEELRDEAELLVDRFPLKAADALQLSAALVWCGGRTAGRYFISGDRQLLEAARQLGFMTIEA